MKKAQERQLWEVEAEDPESKRRMYSQEGVGRHSLEWERIEPSVEVVVQREQCWVEVEKDHDGQVQDWT